MGSLLENHDSGDTGLLVLVSLDGLFTLVAFLTFWLCLTENIMKPNSGKKPPNDFCVWLLVGLATVVPALIAAVLWPITLLVMFLSDWCERDGYPSCCGIKSGRWKRRSIKKMNRAHGGNTRDEESQSVAVNIPPSPTDGMELPSYPQAIASRP